MATWLQAVARIGVEGFKQLLICTGKNMKPQSWQKAGNFLEFAVIGVSFSCFSSFLFLFSVVPLFTRVPFGSLYDGQVTTCILELFKDSMPTKLMEVDAKVGSWS
jgi:hypothetical protein